MLQPKKDMVDRMQDAFRKKLLQAVIQETMRMTMQHNKQIEEQKVEKAKRAETRRVKKIEKKKEKRVAFSLNDDQMQSQNILRGDFLNKD